MTGAFLHPFARPAREQFITLTRGDGALVWDAEGNEYVDSMASLWYCAIGHGRAEMADAIARQAGTLAAYSCFDPFTNGPADALAEQLVGLTPIRESDIQSQAMTEMAPKLGGLVEFYRSPARVAWTPTGTNVPDYPKLAQLWWKNVAVAVTGEKTPQEAMDTLADEMDQVMARLQRAGMEQCAPKLNAKGDPAKWLSDQQAPWKKLDNEKPKGETIAYEKLLNAWKEGRVR